jgi:hypothetical protein
LSKNTGPISLAWDAPLPAGRSKFSSRKQKTRR